MLILADQQAIQGSPLPAETWAAGSLLQNTLSGLE